jgi:hypothetical protein
LLGSVRRDISDYNEGGGMQSLTRERNAIANSQRELESVLGQARATQNQIVQQRGFLHGISDKLKVTTRAANSGGGGGAAPLDWRYLPTFH